MNRMTAEERAEYDQLMLEAGTDADGKPLPSHAIGPRVLKALSDAAHQAHRTWAMEVLNDIYVSGCLKRWKDWNRGRAVITVAGETYVTTKAAAMSVMKQAEGRQYFQLTFWEDMSRDELTQIIASSAGRIDSERTTIATARRLLKLLDRAPSARTVAQAADQLSIELDEYLGQSEAA
jgi:hypothetical protein